MNALALMNLGLLPIPTAKPKARGGVLTHDNIAKDRQATILMALLDEDMTSIELHEDHLPGVPYNTVRKDLAALRHKGKIVSYRVSNAIYYQLTDDA